MIRSRSLALAGLVALTVATPAGASGCPYITDPVGDLSPVTLVFASPAIDIVAAGVEVDATTLTTMIEVDDLVPPGPLGSAVYDFSFDLASTNHSVRTTVFVTPSGVSGVVHVRRYTPFLGAEVAFGDDESSFRVPATADPATDQIRLTVPLTALLPGARMPDGTVLSHVGADAHPVPGTVTTPEPVPAWLAPAAPYTGPGGDSAWTPAVYVAGDPGCV